jgi:MFS family permease
LVGVLLNIPVGHWADRRGRKPVIVAGWGLGTLGALAMALAPDWRWLILGLSAYQISNFALPAYSGYVAAASTDETRTRTFATLAAASAVGSIFSPTLGGWIGTQVGLRAVYLTAAVIFALSTLAVAWLRPQAVLVPSRASIAPRLWTDRAFRWEIGFIFLLFFALELGQVMVPNFLQDERGLKVGQIGQLGTIGALGIVCLTLLIGRMPARRRRGLVLSQLAALVALLLWLVAPALPWIALAYFLHGSNRVARPAVDGRLALRLPAERLSVGYGFRETAMRLGQAVAPWVAGVLYAQNHTWPLAAGLLALGVTLLLTGTLPTGRSDSSTARLETTSVGADPATGKIAG